MVWEAENLVLLSHLRKGSHLMGLRGEPGHFVSMVWEDENLVLLSLSPKGHLMGLGENPIASIDVAYLFLFLCLKGVFSLSYMGTVTMVKQNLPNRSHLWMIRDVHSFDSYD